MNTPTTSPPRLDPVEELEALLPAYFQGQTTEEETHRVEDALRESITLQESAEETLRVMDMLSGMPRHTATRPLRDAIYAQLDAPIPLWTRLRPYAAAALFLLVVGGIVWMQTVPRPVRQTDSATYAARPGDPSSEATAWLARSQHEDGSWDVEHYGGRRHLAAGVQGLALMALLQDGETYREGVARAARHLQGLQNEDGSFGGGGTRMYNHGIVTLALLQARRVQPLSERESFEPTLTKALAFIAQTQVKDGGWGYFGRDLEASNTAVSAWQTLALQEAQRQGRIPGDAPVLEKALAFLRHQAGDGEVVQYGTALVHQQTEAMPAMTALCLLQSADPDAQRIGRNILETHANRDTAEAGRLHPYRAWFVRQARPETSPQFRSAVALTQIEHGSDAGSIPALTSDWGHVGGTVYATAMNSLAAHL